MSADLWRAISAAGAQSEREAAQARLAEIPFSYAENRRVLERAIGLVEGCRSRADERSVLDVFLGEFGLRNEEGIALMCISEALLRIPDDDTAEALISEKIATANWADHVGQSDSLFLNASVWALMLTGNVIGLGTDITGDVQGWINQLAGRIGESVARAAMSQAVRILGAEFVQGRTIEEALAREKAHGGLSSFDMLGEGARTYSDAARYSESYLHAIQAIGSAYPDATPAGASGVSIKLSALHPRFEPLQGKRVLDELGHRLLDLAREAAIRVCTSLSMRRRPSAWSCPCCCSSVWRGPATSRPGTGSVSRCRRIRNGPRPSSTGWRVSAGRSWCGS